MADLFGVGSSIVLDSSVVINLNATQRTAEILRALPVKVEVTELVLDELKKGEAYGYDDGSKLRYWLDQGLMELVQLAGDELAIYRELVAGDARQTLADGEASTIARAVESGAVAAIDERKAFRLCAHRFRTVRVLRTVEILLHELVRQQLGPQGVVEAIYLALRDARMYVPPGMVDAVVSLISAERAVNCLSLPRQARDSL